MLFNGTNESLKSSPLGITNTNFTVEAWVMLSSGGQNRIIAASYNVAPYQANTMALYVDNANKVNFSNGLVAATNPTASLLNTWIHVAGVYTHSNITLTLYVNGISVATQLGAITNESVNGFFVGGSNGDGNIGTWWWNGYISNLRVTKSAVYTANFTPPTAPVTAIANTALLLNGTNAGVFDNAIKNHLATIGNAQVSTSVKKYGTGSISFDGTGDYLTIPATPNLNLSTGNFTVECWYYQNSPVAGAYLFAINGAFNVFAQAAIAINGSGAFFFLCANNATNNWINTSTGGSYTSNTWNHLAGVRNGNTFTLYLNGTSVITYTSSATLVNTSTYNRNVVGIDSSFTTAINGYIDDLRITKGVARYTANFTPPIQAFPNQ
jgi:hypothetical protein